MPYNAAELVGLPSGGPTSRDAVKAHLRITDDRDDVSIDGKVDAVNRAVRSWPVSTAAVDQAEWPADIAEGATMLAARLFRRRNSPAGVEQFAGAPSPAYVMRNDPDVAMLLKLGNHTPPQVG